MSVQELRNIYPGEAVLIDDKQLIRVQTFEASGTLNSEDINELGNNEIVEAIDDIPTVAINITQYDYASIDSEALIAKKNPALTRFIRISDFDKASVTIVVPIIRGRDYSKTNANVPLSDDDHLKIYRSMYVENAYINSIEFTYSTGDIANESLSLESSNKKWLFNEAASVISAECQLSDGDEVLSGTYRYKIQTNIGSPISATGTDFTIASGAIAPAMTRLNDGSYTHGKSRSLISIIRVVDDTDDYSLDQSIIPSGPPAQIKFAGTIKFGNPNNIVPSVGDFYIELSSDTTVATGKVNGIAIITNKSEIDGYIDNFDNPRMLVRYSANDNGAFFLPDSSQIGGVRQGNALIYLAGTLKDQNGIRKIDKSSEGVFFRVQTVTINASLTREVMNEVGHFEPYARSLTFPVPITISLESIDVDASLFAKLSNKIFDPHSDTNIKNDVEVSLNDISKEFHIVIKLFRYNDIKRREIYAALKNEHPNQEDSVAGFNLTDAGFDEELSQLPAYGGDGEDYSVIVSGKTYYTHDLAPSKIVVVKNMIPTDENQSLSVGSNANQSFGFRSNTTMFMGIGGGNIHCLSSDGKNHGNDTGTGTEIPGKSFSGGSNPTFREVEITLTGNDIGTDELFITAGGETAKFGSQITTGINDLAVALANSINSHPIIGGFVTASSSGSMLTVISKIAGSIGSRGLGIQKDTGQGNIGAISFATDKGLDAGAGEREEYEVEYIPSADMVPEIDILSIRIGGILRSFGGAGSSAESIIPAITGSGSEEADALLFSQEINSFFGNDVSYVREDATSGSFFIVIRNTFAAIADISDFEVLDIVQSGTNLDWGSVIATISDVGVNPSIQTNFWQAMKYAIITPTDTSDV